MHERFIVFVNSLFFMIFFTILCFDSILIFETRFVSNLVTSLENGHWHWSIQPCKVGLHLFRKYFRLITKFFTTMPSMPISQTTTSTHSSARRPSPFFSLLGWTKRTLRLYVFFPVICWYPILRFGESAQERRRPLLTWTRSVSLAD